MSATPESSLLAGYAGNTYELANTQTGEPTFRHCQTGEFLHGHAGAWKEALEFYVAYSLIQSHKGPFTVYDAGMGCGAQLMAFYFAFLQNKSISSLQIISFDLEKQGLQAVLDHLDVLPYAQPYEEFLRRCLQDDNWQMQTPDGRYFSWHFQKGDFCKTIHDSTLPLADFISYDFFSPRSHPHLWTYEILRTVYEQATGKGSAPCRLLSFSGATAFRAALLAAGFFVSAAPASGKKSASTLASTRLEELKDELLDERWQQRFFRSPLAISPLEPLQNHEVIKLAITQHPQFKRTTP